MSLNIFFDIMDYLFFFCHFEFAFAIACLLFRAYYYYFLMKMSI